MKRTLDEKDTNEMGVDPTAISPEGPEDALTRDGEEKGSEERRALSSQHRTHVVMGPTRSAKKLKDAEGAALAILMTVGATFVLLGLADTVLLWFPVRMGNPAWEFATLSRMMDVMPMFALGFALLAYAHIARPVAQKKHAGPLAVSSAAVAIVFLALGALYMTVTPVVVSNTPTSGGTRKILNNVRLLGRFIEPLIAQLFGATELFTSLTAVSG